LYNNYVTLGGGFLTSSNRSDASKSIALDFHFHIRRQYFQTGILMSGADFNSNNDFQTHLGYGIRKEKAKTNLAAFAGLTYFFGVETVSDTAYGVIPRYYQGVGMYGCGQITAKLTYDIGIGFEMFGEYSPRRSMAGFKMFLFFSGSYRGPKRNYNPHVRSENQK
jgi:hypothetical protein